MPLLKSIPLLLIILLFSSWMHAQQAADEAFFDDHFLRMRNDGLIVHPDGYIYTIDKNKHMYKWDISTGELLSKSAKIFVQYLGGNLVVYPANWEENTTFSWEYDIYGKNWAKSWFGNTNFTTYFNSLDVAVQDQLNALSVSVSKLNRTNSHVYNDNDDSLAVYTFPEGELVSKVSLDNEEMYRNSPQATSNKTYTGLLSEGKQYVYFIKDAIYVWDVKTGELVNKIQISNNFEVQGIYSDKYIVHDVHPTKDHYLISYKPKGNGDVVLARLNLDVGKLDLIYDTTLNVSLVSSERNTGNRISYSKDGSKLLCAYFRDRVSVYDAGNGEKLVDLMQPIVPLRLNVKAGHVQDIYKLEPLPNGRLESSDKAVISSWDINEGTYLGERINPRYREGNPVIGTAKLLEGEVDLCSVKDLRTYLLSGEPTADQRYVYKKGNYLTPVCPDKTDTLWLDFTPTGIGRSGKIIFRFDSMKLSTWSYPELKPLQSIDLNSTKKSFLECTTGEAFDRYSLSASGKYFTVFCGSLIATWSTSNGELFNLRTFVNPKFLSGAAKAIPEYLYNVVVQDIHPAKDIVLVHYIQSKNVYVGRLDLRSGNIDLVYDSGFENRRHEVHRAEQIGGHLLGSTLNEGLSYRLNRYSIDGEMVITYGFTEPIKVFDEQDGTEKYRLESPADSYSDQLTLDSATGDIIFSSLYRRKIIHLGESVSISTVDTAEKTVPKEKIVYTDLPNRYYYTEKSENGIEVFETFEEIRDHYQRNRRISITEELDVPPPPIGPALRFVTWNKKSDKNDIYRLYQLRDTQTIAYRYIKLPREALATLISHGDEKFAYTYQNKIIIRSTADEWLGENTYETVEKYENTQSLAFSQDGRHLFQALGDGKIHIYDGNTAAYLATFIPLYENDWVVIGPDNVFDASPGAFDGIYFVAMDENRNRDTLGLDQMKERYYDPGLLQKIMGYHEAPIRSGKSLREVKLFPKAKLKLKGDSLQVQLMPRSGGVGRVALFVNGKELDADARPNQDDLTFTIDLTAYQEFYLRNNVLSIRTYNEEESLRSGDISEKYEYADGPVLKQKGSASGKKKKTYTKQEIQNASLHVICVGTSDYVGKSIDLTFPNKDARSMSKAFQSTGNALFGTNGTVTVHCLTTDSAAIATSLAVDSIQWQYATKANIRQVFEDVRQKAKALDVVVVYLSGHGKTVNVNNKEQFHYLTHLSNSANVIDRSTLGDIAISSAELTDWIKKIPAYKQVVIIDACNSGQMISDLGGTRNLNGSQVRALDRMSSRAGMYLIAGSAGDMVSYESSEYGQGVLTYALLKGMRNGGGLVKDEEAEKNHFIGVTELFEYAKTEVPSLTKNIGIQEPQVTYPAKAGSFPMGIYNKDVDIPLADAKPLLIRSQFQNDLTFADNLELEEKVAAKFRAHSKSKTGSYVYANVSSLPNAYQVRGQYILNSKGKVEVRAALCYPGKTPILLKIDTKKPSKIAGAINLAVRKELNKMKPKKVMKDGN